MRGLIGAPVALGRDTLSIHEVAIVVLKAKLQNILQLKPKSCGSVTNSDGMQFPSTKGTIGEQMFTQPEDGTDLLLKFSGPTRP